MMNERIKELKEQAFNFVARQNMCKKEYFWENIRHNPELQDSVDAKFAELIVKECCEQFAKHPYVGTKRTQYIYGYIQGRVDAEQQIKEHFGVEE
jgi:hypothetical protein